MNQNVLTVASNDHESERTAQINPYCQKHKQHKKPSFIHFVEQLRYTNFNR